MPSIPWSQQLCCPAWSRAIVITQPRLPQQTKKQMGWYPPHSGISVMNCHQWRIIYHSWTIFGRKHCLSNEICQEILFSWRFCSGWKMPSLKEPAHWYPAQETGMYIFHPRSALWGSNNRILKPLVCTNPWWGCSWKREKWQHEDMRARPTPSNRFRLCPEKLFKYFLGEENPSHEGNVSLLGRMCLFWNNSQPALHFYLSPEVLRSHWL